MSEREQEARTEMERRFADDDDIASRVRQAVRQAVREHKRADNPVVAWRNERVVLVPPRSIRLEADED